MDSFPGNLNDWYYNTARMLRALKRAGIDTRRLRQEFHRLESQVLKHFRVYFRKEVYRLRSLNNVKFFVLCFPHDMHPEVLSFMEQLHAELEMCGERMQSERTDEPNRMMKDAKQVRKQIESMNTDRLLTNYWYETVESQIDEPFYLFPHKGMYSIDKSLYRRLLPPL
jgi:hypothetical protein